MKEKNYRRLTLKERHLIEGYLRDNKTVTEIAVLLSRSKSTISREIKRGRYFKTNYYIAEHADFSARLQNKAKRLDPKMMLNNALRIYVFRGLIKGWSPEQISQRIKQDYPLDPGMRISYEAIYMYIYRYTNGKLRKKLIDKLVYSKPRRIGKSKRYIYSGTIIDRVSIDERPEEVNDRKEVGHWESDLIIGKDQKSAIGTIVERSSRYTIIVPLQSRKSEHVVKAFADELLAMPSETLKTLTHDNGIEMAMHKMFTERTKMPVYFAHPYSSWERGTNENTNGLIRRVFKKKTDFNKVSIIQLKDLQSRMNHRPRKVIGYKTPTEKLQELCN